jgi:hypothetical protein
MARPNTFRIMDKKSRKKFKETKVGKFLKEKSPKILDVVGDILPDSGALGIAKNLINMAEDLTQDEKDSLIVEIDDMIEMARIEFEDRNSARNREIEIAKLHNRDVMFIATGAIGLLAFAFIVYAIAFLHIPDENKEIWIHLIGITEGVVLSIFGYYFGSSIKRNVQ